VTLTQSTLDAPAVESEGRPSASLPARSGDGPSGLYAKLADAFAALEEVERDKRHENQGWSYSSADAVKRAVRDELRNRRVLVLPAAREYTERPFETSNGKQRIVTTASLEFTLVDAETGESMTLQWLGAGADDAEKGLGKAITVGLRTFLSDLFLLPAGEDTSAGGSGGGGRSSGRGTNEKGEKLASWQQLRDIETAATGRMTAVAFLNLLLAARGIDPVETTEDEAIAGFRQHLEALTTQQANDALARIKEATSS
jgi:hypothetical protein